MTSHLLASLGRYIPECIITITMMSLLYLEATYKDEKLRAFMNSTAAIGLIATLLVLILNLKMPGASIFTNAVVIDPFSSFMKIMMTIATLAVVWINIQSKDINYSMKGEFLILSFGILIGGMLLASSFNFLTVFLAIEILSILSYVMASFSKDDTKSSEAGLKYVLYGGLSSGIMLFGISHIYGVLGTIQFSEVNSVILNLPLESKSVLMISFVLFFVGLGYKMATVPFHMWSPDVYEGSPIPVTMFFSMVPKLAALAVIVRVTEVFFYESGQLQNIWIGLLTVMSALTMTVGNVSAIGQRSVKRMLAYSSIAHAGFLLAGATVIGPVGNKSLLFYSTAYIFMTIIAFSILSYVSDHYKNDHFERFNGLIYRHPYMAIAMSITMFSLAGIPPFSGFTSKFNILNALVKNENYTLAIVAGLNSVISLYYYMKIVRLMVFRQSISDEPIGNFGPLNQIFIGVATVPVIVLGIFWDKIIILAQNSVLFR